jgi:anaphase-promoting complex subunit 6
MFPKKEIAWFAVGLYYICIREFVDARRYLKYRFLNSKATAIHSNFGLAWMAFGHSFALEGEHDSAISIYASASKILPNSHLPFLFLGMEHAKMSDWKLAEDYLLIALEMNDADPILLHELGAVYYGQQKYPEAILRFQSALDLVKKSLTPLCLWSKTICNLGHANRKMK